MSRTTQLLITIAILAGGVSATIWIKNSNPKPERKAPEVVARLVEARELERETTRPTWPAGGTVNASDEVSLAAQVSARVEWISPEAIPGARLSKGTLLARLESADFDFAVKQKQAAKMPPVFKNSELLILRNVIDRCLNSSDLFSFFIRDLGIKLFF